MAAILIVAVFMEFLPGTRLKEKKLGFKPSGENNVKNNVYDIINDSARSEEWPIRQSDDRRLRAAYITEQARARNLHTPACARAYGCTTTLLLPNATALPASRYTNKTRGI